MRVIANSILKLDTIISLKYLNQALKNKYSDSKKIPKRIVRDIKNGR